jgi:uncharacterized protein (TIGR00369 family)
MWPPVPTDRDFMISTGFDALYGLELLEIGPREGRARVVVTDAHKQPFGLVHGGVYAAVAESLASHCTAAGVLSESKSANGLSNQTSFLRPILEGTIHAEAVCKHAGRTTWVWEIELSDDQGRTCALSRVTIAVRDLPVT